jgi:acyl-CoA reductase-like NAD-dependent aldehyde dehydrogenase
MIEAPVASALANTIRCRWSSNDAADCFDVENPATGEVIANVQGAGESEVDRAVRAAHAAFESDWRWRPPRERGKYLIDAAAVLRKHADEIARLETLENGKPLTQSRPFDVEALIGSFEFFGGLADKPVGEFTEMGWAYNQVLLEPYGVVAGVIPFNWPPIHTGSKAAPALALGNTVVLKPGEQAPLAIMRIVEILQDILPPDVIHVVPGLGPKAGKALISHKLVKKISFTGSTATGISVLKQAAENLTPALLELGGKNAFIVFDDADIERAVTNAIDAAFFNQGEACTAASRILVQEGVYDRFVERLAKAVSRLVVGDGMDSRTHVGPLVTKAQQQKVLRGIEDALARGAKIAAQAELPAEPYLKNGYFVAPTLFTNVSADMPIVREELFGPVTYVMPFKSFDEVVSIANDTEYGLVAGVFSESYETIMRVARRLDVGVVFANTYNRSIIGTPFGGTKASGYGREHAVQTLREFGRQKVVRLPSGEGEIPLWFGAREVTS